MSAQSRSHSAQRLAVCAAAILIGLFGLGLLLFGAAAPVAANSERGTAQASAPQATITGPITLWYGYDVGGAEETALMQVISNARSAYPGANITATAIPFADLFTLYQTQVISGGGPDMFVAPNDSLGDQVRAGVIRNLDAYLQGRLGSVTPTALAGMQLNGQFYGVPESAKAVALYYNKLAVPTPPTSTTALLALVQSGKKLAIVNDGSAGGAYFNFGFWSAFGGQLLDTNGRCIADRGGFTPAVQYLLDLKHAGASLIPDFSQGQAAFRAGTLDLFLDGPWALVDYETHLGANVGVVPMPAGPGGSAAPINGIDGFYVNPNTHNFTSTVELALYLTNQQSSQIFTNVAGHVPIRSDVAASDPLVNAFSQASAQGFPRPQIPQINSYWAPFGALISDVLSGATSPAAGVMNACDQMNIANGFPVYLSWLPATLR